MTAYLRSLNVLAENVRSQLAQCRLLADAIPLAAPQASAGRKKLDRAAAVLTEGFDLLVEQLDADCREVRADVEALIEGGQQW